MYNPAFSNRQLLTYYLQVLHDAKTQQILYYARCLKGSYSEQFKNFLADQKENTRQQHTALKTIADLLGIYLSGESCDPIRDLLREAAQVGYFSPEDNDTVEPTVARLLQGVKHHEMLVSQGAILLAHDLEENEIGSTLSEIASEEKQAYQQLQSFAVRPWQPKMSVTNVDTE